MIEGSGIWGEEKKKRNRLARLPGGIHLISVPCGGLWRPEYGKGSAIFQGRNLQENVFFAGQSGWGDSSV